MLEMSKARKDWIEEEEEVYTGGRDAELADVLGDVVDGDGRVLNAVHVEGDLGVVLLRALLAAEDLHQVDEGQTILEFVLELALDLDVANAQLGVDPGLEGLWRIAIIIIIRKRKDKVRECRPSQ